MLREANHGSIVRALLFQFRLIHLDDGGDRIVKILVSAIVAVDRETDVGLGSRQGFHRLPRRAFQTLEGRQIKGVGACHPEGIVALRNGNGDGALTQVQWQSFAEGITQDKPPQTEVRLVAGTRRNEITGGAELTPHRTVKRQLVAGNQAQTLHDLTKAQAQARRFARRQIGLRLRKRPLRNKPGLHFYGGLTVTF